MRRALPGCLRAYGQVTGTPAWPKLLFRMLKSWIPVTPSLLKSARRSVALLNVDFRTWLSGRAGLHTPAFGVQAATEACTQL